MVELILLHLACSPTCWLFSSSVMCFMLSLSDSCVWSKKGCWESMWRGDTIFHGESGAHSGLWNMLSCGVNVLKILGNVWSSGPWTSIIMWKSWLSALSFCGSSFHGVRRSLENVNSEGLTVGAWKVDSLLLKFVLKNLIFIGHGLWFVNA